MIKQLCVAFSMLTIGATAQAQTREKTLVIGMNISDGRTYDPSRQADVSTPFTIGNTYETLITVSSDNYEILKPSLANRWELSNNNASWRFYLRDSAKFWNGKSVTAQDVKFSFDRLKYLKDQPAEFTDNIEKIEIVNNKVLDIFPVNMKEPLLPILTTVSFAVFSKEELEKIGGVGDVSAKDKDSATKVLDRQSFGSGPYRMTSWTRNESVILERNKYWHRPLQFDRVIIKHLSESSSQLLAIRNGDIDLAFNLSSEHINTLKNDKRVRVESVASLDYVYMVLTASGELNKNLADRNARLAVAHSIDYQGIIDGILQGYAIRPPSILPIGMGGTTTKDTHEYGYRLDLFKAKEYLAKAGLSEGFSFNLSYPTSPILNANTSILAQKIQADLAKVNIKANLTPLDTSTSVTQYRTGKAQAALVSYTIDALEPSLWTKPFVGRIAKRVHWTPEEHLIKLSETAPVEVNLEKRNQMYREFQKLLVEEALYINILQPVYKVAVTNRLKNINLTAAGWYMNIGDISR